MGSRRKGRILAFQTLYRYEMTGESLSDVIEFSWLDEKKQKNITEETFNFARLLITGTIEKLDIIDATIKSHLEHWDFSRLSKVDLAVLRISVYCLLYQKSIPETVTIDEAIDIVKEYSTEESYRFINGVLDAINKDRLHH
jgi:N utilization substance protein B